MLEVILTEAAEEEYTESLRWYAKRSRRAAQGLEAHFAKALREVAADPDRYPLCDERHRFYLLKRYPFQLIYRKLRDDLVLVVALAHTSRRPGYWAER